MTQNFTNFITIAVFGPNKFVNVEKLDFNTTEFTVTQVHFMQLGNPFYCWIPTLLRNYFEKYSLFDTKIVNVYGEGYKEIALWGDNPTEDYLNPYNFKAYHKKVFENKNQTVEFRPNLEHNFYIEHNAFDTFFSKGSLLQFYKDMLDTNKFTFYIFYGLDWNTIVKSFSQYNIVISGGSNNQRHIMSPLKFQLSWFLLCLYGCKHVRNLINLSFHKTDKRLSSPRGNFYLNKGMREEFKKQCEKNKIYLFQESPFSTPQGSNRGFQTNSIKYNEDIIDRYLKEAKSEDLKNFVTDILNNRFFHNLRDKLNEKETSKKQKQLYMEEDLMDTWRKEINNFFKDPSKLFNSKYGIGILANHFTSLNKDLNDLKEGDKRNLNRKKYKLLFLLMSNCDIMSTIITLAIPFSLKYGMVEDQNFVNLVEKIGNDLIKTFLTTEWINYTESEVYALDIKKPEIIKTNIDNNSDCIVFNKDLTEEEFKNKLKDLVIELSHKDILTFGMDLLDFIAERSQLFNVITVFLDKNSLKRIIVPGKKLDQNIANIIRIDKNLMPMITKPNDWVYKLEEGEYTVDKYGGFLLNSLNKIELIHKSKKSYGSTKLSNLDIVNTVNYLSSTKFEINKKVLEYILNLLDNKDERITELVKINFKNLTPGAYFKGDKELYATLKHNSQYYSDSSILQVALLLYNFVLYFPLFVEWRGRLFTESGFLSYQKSELARSLLLFNTGSLLNSEGLNSLKTYTANCYGKDKLSYNKRLEWVEDNINKIINLDSDLIFSASEPLLFLACCFELKGYYENPKTFISKLPISNDATCNGLQHLSSMVQDTNLAIYVNICKSTKDEVPNDVYQYMVHKVNEKIKNTIREQPEYVMLKYLNIIREFIKRGLMTIPYGVTPRGIANQLKTDHFSLGKKIDNKQTYVLKDNKFKNTEIDVYFTYKEIFKLSQIIHSVLYDTFPTIKSLVEYLKEINSFLKKLTLLPIWLSPAGLIIEQKYVDMKEEKLNSSFLGRRRLLTILEPLKDKVNLRKQNQSIVPNIVHSFDAGNIAILVKQLLSNENYINLFTIHDCFATSANDVQLMKFQVRFAFMLLYSKKQFIEAYHEFIINYIKNSGYIVNCDETEVVLSRKKSLKIPIKPVFEQNKDFIDNILGSEYFIN
jgi:DNA-directed RNA polymerase